MPISSETVASVFVPAEAHMVHGTWEILSVSLSHDKWMDKE